MTDEMKSPPDLSPPAPGSDDGRPKYQYHRMAVPLGPFEEEPAELYRLIRSATDVTWAGWLLGALESAGVELGDDERVSIPQLFADCGIPGVQVIAGWIARAQAFEPRPVADNRRATAGRLLDALDHADVAMGAYDHDMTVFLIEDCGPPAARAVAGWLKRIPQGGPHDIQEHAATH